MSLNLFGDSDLPEVLSEEETIRYFRAYQNGSLEARRILVEHNIRLVIDQVVKKFKNSGHELEDLVSVGTIGLINAVSTYDLEKNIKFHTYASKCIFNEVVIYLKRNNKHLNINSLNEAVAETDNGIEISILDELVDKKVNILEGYLRKESCVGILESLDYLTEKNREILKLYFGFYGGRCYSQLEIAKIYGTTRQNISIIINKNLKKLAKILESKSLIEVSEINIRLLNRN